MSAEEKLIVKDSIVTRGDVIKNSVVALLTYLIVLALLLGAASQWQWSEFVTLLVPSLIIPVAAGAVVTVSVSIFFTIRIGRRVFIASGCAMVLLGLLLILLHRVQPNISNLVGYDVVNFGASAIGIGIAFWSLDIALASDNRMKAIANLEFREKMAVIEDYLSQVRNKEDVVVKALGHEIDAVKQLEKFVGPQLNHELGEKLEELVDEAKKYESRYADLIAEIQRVMANTDKPASGK